MTARTRHDFDVEASTLLLADVQHAWQTVSARPDWPRAMASMRRTQEAITATGGWASGPSTLFDVLEITTNEVLHCRVVRWLLDPLARHGIGALLTADLMDECGLHEPDPASARISVEEIRGDTRADIIVTTPNTGGVVVEAKVYASEGPRQGERIETEWDEAARLVFLTIAGDRLPDTASDRSRWIALSWSWFARRTTTQLARTTDNGEKLRSEARHAAAEWATTVLRHFN